VGQVLGAVSEREREREKGEKGREREEERGRETERDRQTETEQVAIEGLNKWSATPTTTTRLSWAQGPWTHGRTWTDSIRSTWGEAWLDGGDAVTGGWMGRGRRERPPFDLFSKTPAQQRQAPPSTTNNSQRRRPQAHADARPVARLHAGHPHRRDGAAAAQWAGRGRA